MVNSPLKACPLNNSPPCTLSTNSNSNSNTNNSHKEGTKDKDSSSNKEGTREIEEIITCKITDTTIIIIDIIIIIKGETEETTNTKIITMTSSSGKDKVLPKEFRKTISRGIEITTIIWEANLVIK